MKVSLINPTWFCDIDSTNREPYHEVMRDSKSLLVTIGDSWTWGDSLGTINKKRNIIDDYNHRTSNIYGYHLSNKLNVDWANIAVCGIDSIAMMLLGHQFLQGITKKYNNIHVVITLTESGRDLASLFSADFKNKYDSIKGDSWPDFDHILNKNIDLTSIIEECNIKGWIYTELYLGLHQTIKTYKDLEDLLIKYEAYIFNVVRRLFKSCTVGRNFTKSYLPNCNLLKDSLLDYTWTDVISNNGKLNLYPDVRVMSNIGLEPLIRYIDNQLPKEQMISLFDMSIKGIDWLDNSPYNSKVSTRHPLEQAHVWWADYLYKPVKEKLT